MKYRVLADKNEADAFEQQAWSLYYAEEIERRGLKDGDSLNTWRGNRVPPVTRFYLRTENIAGFIVAKSDAKVESWRDIQVFDEASGKDVAFDPGVDKGALPLALQLALDPVAP
jgi:hypothetical protein